MSTQQSGLEAEIRGLFPKPHTVIACLATVDAARHFSPELRTMTLIELDWRFCMTTGAGTRKVREMTAHTAVAALAMFKRGGFSGYLRISGMAEPVNTPAERKRIYDAAAYQEGRWKGAEDPDIAFFRIVPERIEYMRPGDDAAKDVTSELLRKTGVKTKGEQ